ncbi:MAG: hypothetical protein IBX55_00795 [Methyloprofundus sp.]|nr:hypothetical protein [Methyloprofundus sp.]
MLSQDILNSVYGHVFSSSDAKEAVLRIADDEEIWSLKNGLNDLSDEVPIPFDGCFYETVMEMSLSDETQDADYLNLLTQFMGWIHELHDLGRKEEYRALNGYREEISESLSDSSIKPIEIS